MIKIDEKVLKKMGWIKPKKMFAAVSFTHMLSNKPDLSMLKSIQIAGNYYEVDKGMLTSWMLKLKKAYDDINDNPPPVPIIESSAECTEWEQKMTELEAVVIG